MPDAANVQVAATGALYIAAIGTTAPTNASAAWPAGWKELGYLSDDGVTETPTLDSEEIKAWQNGAVVRTPITGSRFNIGFTVIETRYEVLELFYPGSVITQETGPPLETKLDIRLPLAKPWAFGLDVIDGTMLERTILKRAELFERGERNNQNAAARGFPMVLSASPDSVTSLAVRFYQPQLVAAA